MTLRYLLASSLAVLCLGIAGCGDDEESPTSTNTGNTSAAKTLKDIEPRATKPNVVGGNAPIAELLSNAAGDAVGYWGQVFQNSNLPYEQPKLNIASSPTDDGCGGTFDPAQRPFFLCATDAGSTISLSAPAMDKIRSSAGDAAVVFLSGMWVAVDTNDQLQGRPLSKSGKIDAEFAATAGCFTGAWIRNLADRQILEAGDDQEVLQTAEQAIGQGIGAEAVKNGFTNGAAACQGGGGGGQPDQGGGTPDTGGGEQPPPSPSE